MLFGSFFSLSLTVDFVFSFVFLVWALTQICTSNAVKNVMCALECIFVLVGACFCGPNVSIILCVNFSVNPMKQYFLSMVNDQKSIRPLLLKYGDYQTTDG